MDYLLNPYQRDRWRIYYRKSQFLYGSKIYTPLPYFEDFHPFILKIYYTFYSFFQNSEHFNF